MIDFTEYGRSDSGMRLFEQNPGGAVANVACAGARLGLSTAFGIIKQHGGDILVFSEPDKGSTFKIYFPRVEGAARRLDRPPQTHQPSRGWETVLVAEDDAMVRRFTVRALTQLGYTVLAAGNGDEALRVAAEYAGDIHLLLTDIVMPQMGGCELADCLRAARPQTPVLYTTGYLHEVVVQQGANSGDMPVLAKPFTKMDLARKVREVLDGGRTGQGAGETDLL